jgi:DNA polymerase delta subunit 2
VDTYRRLKDSKQKYSTKSKDTYLLKKKDFQQFSSLYFGRLKELKSKVETRAIKKHPDATLATRILQLTHGAKFIVTGTLFKDMRLKPNILQEYTREVSY